MGNADFRDGEAMAAALDELHEKRRKEEAAHRADAEKKAKRRVTLTAGEVAEITYELRKALDLAERSGVTKEPRLRTASINVAAGLKPLIKKLEARIPEYATALERGSGA